MPMRKGECQADSGRHAKKREQDHARRATPEYQERLRRRRADPKWQAKRREWQRQYRHANPEYREQAQERSREYYREHQADPEWREQERKRLREYARKRREADPEWHEQEKERKRERRRVRREIDPEWCNRERERGREYVRKYRERLRQLKYGLVEGEYEKMFSDQNGVCVICGKPETRKLYGAITALAVDHDHETGEVRGLLCGKCNLGLGQIGDVLEEAQNYLKAFRRRAESQRPQVAAQGGG